MFVLSCDACDSNRYSIKHTRDLTSSNIYLASEYRYNAGKLTKFQVKHTGFNVLPASSLQVLNYAYLHFAASRFPIHLTHRSLQTDNHPSHPEPCDQFMHASVLSRKQAEPHEDTVVSLLIFYLLPLSSFRHPANTCYLRVVKASDTHTPQPARRRGNFKGPFGSY